MSESAKGFIKYITVTLFCLALALAGTYAATTVLEGNKANSSVNAGGRLHNDFDGKNKDIYVENFTDTVDGTAIYARIKIKEYMEFGSDAGLKLESDSRNARSIIDGADVKDTNTWTTLFSESNSENSAEISKYVDLGLGGSTVYMPTFNLNKDSKAADINGTYRGKDGYFPGDVDDASDKYSDYVSYSVGDEVVSYEIYDNDENTDDEVDKTIVDALTETDVNLSLTSDELKAKIQGLECNIKVLNYDADSGEYSKITHTAKETNTASVISMQEWVDSGEPVGDYWVYDTDGWIYYAKKIEPSETSGLLIDYFNVKNVGGRNWYYAMNVEAQFISADDAGYANNTSFWTGGAPTDNAKHFLRELA
jgi:hypothetical protein